MMELHIIDAKFLMEIPHWYAKMDEKSRSLNVINARLQLDFLLN
jgi:hypothetical protein